MNSGLSHTHPMEKTLEAYFQAYEPSEEFTISLERRLQEEIEMRAVGDGRQKPTPLSLHAQPRKAPRWAPVMMVLVALAVIILLLVGPQRALAQVMRILGYVPGIGFIDADAARVLAEPAVMEQQGVTLRIEQVLVTDEGTTVLVEASGLPPRAELFSPNASWTGQQPEGMAARIHLVDGTVLESSGGGAGIGKTGEVVLSAHFDFPPLPSMVYHAVLELPYLPLIPTGAAPGNWVLPFSLAPVAEGQSLEELTPSEDSSTSTGMEGEDIPPAVELPQPTTVDAQSQPAQQYSLQVINVVYTAQETALQVQINGLDPAWSIRAGLMGQLTDDQGNTYDQQYPANFGSEEGNLQSLVFDPVLNDGRRLTLRIERLLVDVPSQGQVLRLDMGEDPQVGDTISINQTVGVYGLPVEFRSVSLSEAHAQAEGRPETVRFDFHIAPVQIKDYLSLNMIGFGREVGDAFGGNLLGYGGGFNGVSPEGTNLVLYLDYDRSQLLPTGVLEILLEGIQLSIGPLEVSWQAAP
jgi:hypothetical protein